MLDPSTASSDRPGATPPSPRTVLGPDEIQAGEHDAATVLPPQDQQSVERSAGEGMVGTTVEAAVQPVRHLTTQAMLELLNGQPVGLVAADLQFDSVAWSGTISPVDGIALAPGGYVLTLPEGRALTMVVTGQVGQRYTVEAAGPGDDA